MRIRIDDDLTFRKLEAFLAYMKAGSMMGAAELLDTSAISVHRAIHSLEKALSCTLFQRAGRNLVPTAAAYILARAAEDIIARTEAGILATREAAGFSADKLKIGSLYSLTHYWLPEIIKAMDVRRPDVQCELTLGRSKHELLPKLRDGLLDVVFSEPSAAYADILAIPILKDRMYFAVHLDSALATRASIDLQSCSGERLATLTEGPLTSSRLRERFPAFKPKALIEVEDIFTQMNLVSNGVACALTYGRIMEMFSHKIRFIPVEPDNLSQTIGLSFMRARERDPNILALVAAVRLLLKKTR
ncbi:MAG: LysR family transcriptional regulator [Pigmentiphaga sp.]|nr:LysR family transcriptional regulator [Pigmentiphaga sp.]